MSSLWLQFRLLVWKNFVLQKRQKLVTLVEFLVPAVLAVLLLSIRRIAPCHYHANATVFSPFEVDLLPSHIPNKQIFKQLSILFGKVGTGQKALPVAYTPNISSIQSVIRNVAQKLGYNGTGMGFKTESEMDHFIKYGTVDIFAGVVFTNLLENGSFPKNIEYKIRMKAKGNGHNPMLSVETWYTGETYPFNQIIGPRMPKDNEGGVPGYYLEGFLAFQHTIDIAVIEYISHKKLEDIDVKMQRFPYPPYLEDEFQLALQFWLPMIILLSYLYAGINLVKALVHEKDQKLKESMKMMGLRGWLHWAAWFTKGFMMLFFSTVLIIVLWVNHMFNDLAIFEHSNGVIILLFLLMYAMTNIAFAFLISVCFSKANTAATVAGLLWFLTYVPYFFLDPRYDSMSYNSKMVSCLISNTAMAMGIKIITMYEGSGSGIQWSNIDQGFTPQDDFTLVSVFFMLFIDCIVYILLTWYIEAVFPGDIGIPQHWYFPFTKSYWCQSSAIEHVGDMLPEAKRHITPEYFEPDPTNIYPGIQIKNLSKVYYKKEVAVNRMNLNMYEGQITVLLGHNGAGKTTTMSMLTGLIPPSQGTAIINGHDIRENMNGVRSSLGLCPQHDVLFDNLTVAEHLYLFSKLKGEAASAVTPETNRILKMLQLEDKKNSLIQTLSGGMKRKLSVALALISNSKVVMLDEPTSGMDPAARRLTWDLLQHERTGRTILLTTHFMDEADLLGDRIAIMAGGELQCSGTPLFLKKKYGAGYHMIIVKQPMCNIADITHIVQKYLPSAELESNIGAELSYILPHEGVSKFEKLFSTLEQDRDTLGISSFGASVTTMEEVFLRVGEAKNSDNTRAMLQSKHHGQNYGCYSFNKEFKSGCNGFTDDLTASLVNDVPRLNSGLMLYFQQFRAMLVKRILYSRRNWWLTLGQLLLPPIFVFIALFVTRTLPTNDHPQPLAFNLEPYRGSVTPYMITQSASSLPNIHKLVSFYHGQFNGQDRSVNVSNLPDQYSNLADYLLVKRREDSRMFLLHYIVGATFDYNIQKKRMQLTAHFSNLPFHGPGITLSLMDSALLKYFTSDSEYQFTTINHPFPPSVADVLYHGFSSNVGFAVAFNLTFGMALLSSSFVFFLIKERTIKSCHLQFVSGVHFTNFWAANFVWDFICYFFSCMMIMLLFIVMNEDGYVQWDMQVRYITIFVLHGWSMLAQMYVLSFLFKEAATGISRLSLFNVFSGVATLLSVSILLIPELHVVEYGNIVDWICLSFPTYCIGWAFSDLYKNYQVLKLCSYPMVRPFCDLAKITKNCGDYACPEFQDNYFAWERPGIGRMVIFLSCQGFVFFMILAMIEIPAVFKIGKSIVRWLLHCCSRRSKKVYVRLSQDPQSIGTEQELCVMAGQDAAEEDQQYCMEDDDVANERERIERNSIGYLSCTDNLILRDVTKYYGDYLAVDHVSVGIPRGECFGLLGVNGAGKTTTFKMMTGDEPISDGDACVEGYSVTEHIKQVQQRVGYCPQFDALIDEMTGRETLIMYARFRGVPEKYIPSVIMNLAENLLLTEHLEKLVKDYSGGNKRKLSTAIALVGNPPIVFLDEPTTGMDPLARRLLWDAISRVRDSGHSIVLTSHSMEECDVLCTRVAIMVNGQFRCLGSPQHLKNKFGQGYTLVAKVRATDSKNTDAAVQQLRNFIEVSFPGSILKDMHHCMIHYHIQNPKLNWAYIFGTMERARYEYCIEDYSVSQTTLEQVFLNFAHMQRPNDVA